MSRQTVGSCIENAGSRGPAVGDVCSDRALPSAVPSCSHDSQERPAVAPAPFPLKRTARPFLYVANTHFGDGAIIDRYDRPFTSVGEMDRRMIRELRAAEQRGYVVHVGDFSREPPEVFLRQHGPLFRYPSCHVLLAGEHDDPVGHWSAYTSLFWVRGICESWAQNAMVVEDTLQGEPVRVLASHAPRPDLGDCDLNVYGHHHDLLARYGGQLRPHVDWLLASDRHFNVSVELIDYRPRTLDELHSLRHVEGRDLH